MNLAGARAGAQAGAQGWTFLTPPLFWLTLFFLVPMGWLLAYSFGAPDGPLDIKITGTLHNYARAFEPLYLGIFAKSLGFAAVATALCLLIGFPVAFGIAFAPPRWRGIMLTLVMLPFWTNLLIQTYAMMLVLRETGPVNSLIGWLIENAGFGPYSPPHILNTNIAVMIGLVYVHLQFMVLPVYAALDKLDRSLIEASLDLGAGQVRTLFSVIVPLAMPGILSGIMITFIPVMGSFLTPTLLGGTDSQMISTVIEQQFKRANNWPFGAALSFILLYATAALVLLRAVARGRSARRLDPAQSAAHR